MRPPPFALSLSKGFPFNAAGEGEGFDKLSPNGFARHPHPVHPKVLP
jgi:hypothetical protein